MTKEDLLSEAVSKFPVGTVFNNGSIIGRSMSDVTVGGRPRWDYDDIIINIQGGGNFTIYRNGKWADIISGPAGSEPNYSIY
jgi:hypothetical protein